MVEHKNVPSLKKVIKALKNGEKAPENATAEDIQFATDVVNAEKFVKEFIKKNGTKAFISERLRDGYIGKELNINGAYAIQSERGAPHGTLVAMPNKQGTITLGVSYISPRDTRLGHSYPILGVFNALKNCLYNLVDEREYDEGFLVRNKDAQQVDHFKKRALAFFWPDVYSYSRGQEGKKVVYENYEAIHRRRKLILGE